MRTRAYKYTYNSKGIFLREEIINQRETQFQIPSNNIERQIIQGES